MAKTALQVGGLPITPKQLIAGIASLGIAVGEFFLLFKSVITLLKLAFMPIKRRKAFESKGGFNPPAAKFFDKNLFLSKN